MSALTRLPLLLAAVALLATACGGGAQADAEPPEIVLGGIPDQEVALLQERFDGVAAHLSEELGLPVRYQPSTDYAAVVTAFAAGDVQLGWFGGLTGVQARRETPGARAVAQRPQDAAFRSVFVAGPGVEAQALGGLAGTRFTFGSEVSTSGHLMPRSFLLEAGVDPDADLDGPPGYSGSHDRTWKLVEAGSFEAGALSASVWDRAVREGDADLSRVREVARSPAFADYHWLASPRLDEVHGPGTTQRLTQALLTMDEAGPEAERVLALFDDEEFVPTSDDAYDRVEQVARDLGLVGP